VPLVTFRSETGARRAVSPIARNGKLGDGAWRLQRAEARQQAHPAVIVAGYWSQVRPSSSRPPAFGLGLGIVMVTASAAIIGGAPPQRAGMASSIESVSYELGGPELMAITTAGMPGTPK
jgi:hypothetical protein